MIENIMQDRRCRDGLFLRSAKMCDAHSVINIITHTHVSNQRDENKGFLCHFPNVSEYEQRLKYGRYNQVAEYDKKVVGFLTAFSDEEAIEYLDKGFLSYEESIIRSLLYDKFIWLDQLAVYPEKYYRKGIGTRLMKNVLEKASEDDYKLFYGTISIFPETNLASINFLTNLGFKVLHKVMLGSRKWLLVKYTST